MKQKHTCCAGLGECALDSGDLGDPILLLLVALVRLAHLLHHGSVHAAAVDADLRRGRKVLAFAEKIDLHRNESEGFFKGSSGPVGKKIFMANERKGGKARFASKSGKVCAIPQEIHMIGK
jgi:hypothetical protein